MIISRLAPVATTVGLRLSSFVARTVWIQRAPFSFRGREFQINIFDEPKQRILLKFSRQAEKSSHIAIREVLYGAYYDGLQIMHVAPRDEQVRAFSTKRFRKVIRESPRLKWVLAGVPPQVIDNQKDKLFVNTTEATFRSAFRDPDATRGYSADLLAIDEFQDIQRDHIAIIEETQSHATRKRRDGSVIKMRIYAGTPKTFDNPIEESWKGSTQYMWIVFCDHCSHFNEQIGIKNIGPDFLKCARCDGRLDPTNGFWRAYGDPDAEIAGYHLNTLLYEHCDWKDIHAKLDGAQAYSTAAFQNEVLGYSYDAGAKVVTMDEIEACCDDTRHNLRARPRGLDVVFGGLDWGGVGNSTTVAHAGAYVSGKYYVLAARRWPGRDPSQEIPEIQAFFARMGVRYVACDLGAGIRANQDLAQRMAGTARVVQFHNNDSLGGILRWNQGGDFYVISKPRTMSRVFQSLKNKEISFFCWEEFRPFAHDIACVYEEYNQRTRTLSYDHPSTETDDFMHSLNMAKSMADLYFGKITPIANEGDTTPAMY